MNIFCSYGKVARLVKHARIETLSVLNSFTRCSYDKDSKETDGQKDSHKRGAINVETEPRNAPNVLSLQALARNEPQRARVNTIESTVSRTKENWCEQELSSMSRCALLADVSS